MSIPTYSAHTHTHKHYSATCGDPNFFCGVTDVTRSITFVVPILLWGDQGNRSFCTSRATARAQHFQSPVITAQCLQLKCTATARLAPSHTVVAPWHLYQYLCRDQLPSCWCSYSRSMTHCRCGSAAARGTLLDKRSLDFIEQPSQRSGLCMTCVGGGFCFYFCFMDFMQWLI